MTNLPAILSTLNQELSALTEKLAPTNAEHVAEAIKSLLSAGLALPVNMVQEQAPEIYAFAMKNVSQTGLRKVVTKLVRGEYDNISKAFIPLPSELAAMARAETRILVEDVARLKERRDSLMLTLPEKKDDDARERVRKKLQEFREQNAARKAVQSIPQEPMTEEKAEYYQKIMALRDAPDLSAEQMAYRRKIASDVNSVARGDEREAAE